VVELADVEAAREAIGDRLHRTPTFTSRTLSGLVGARVFLKAELFQKTGSFKPRGVLNKLALLSPEEKERGIIAISAGNHAQAVAWACTAAGLDSLVVMWNDASPLKIETARAYGAAVDTEAPTKEEAFDRLAELQEATGRTLFHPFDDPVIQAGAGTVGLEIVEDVPDADVVVVPVGGGGLIAGIATAIGRRTIGVEPELSPSLHEALNAGRSVPVTSTSIADGLGAPFAGENALASCQKHGVESVLVTEDEIKEAMRFLYARTKLACEPAGAAAVAALLAHKIEVERGQKVVAVVSGGNVAAQTAAAILAEQ
jgi:threonine dehydratase